MIIFNCYHIIKAKMEVTPTFIKNDLLHVQCIEIINTNVNTILYSYNYKTNNFYDASNKKLKTPITNIDELTVLVEIILKHNTDYTLILTDNKLKYLITNYNEVSELYEKEKYIAKNHTFKSIVEFITNSSNETIIDYIENVDDLEYYYCKFDDDDNNKPIVVFKFNSVYTNCGYSQDKYCSIIDLIFIYNHNLELIEYICTKDYQQFNIHFLVYFILIIDIDTLRNLIHKPLFDNLLLKNYHLFSILTSLEYIYHDDMFNCKINNELFRNHKHKYLLYSYLIHKNKPHDIKQRLEYQVYSGNFHMFKNTELYKMMEYVKNVNLITIMYNKELDMFITDSNIIFDKIYFLKTNSIDIFKKCNNLVYLEYEGDNIDGIEYINNVLSIYKFKNCKINLGFIIHLLCLCTKNIDIEFDNCIIDDITMQKLKNLKRLKNNMTLTIKNT